MEHHECLVGFQMIEWVTSPIKRLQCRQLELLREWISHHLCRKREICLLHKALYRSNTMIINLSKDQIHLFLKVAERSPLSHGGLKLGSILLPQNDNTII